MRRVMYFLLCGLMPLLNLGCLYCPLLLDNGVDRCSGNIHVYVQESNCEIAFWVCNDAEDILLLRSAHDTYAYAVEYASDVGDEVLEGGGMRV